MSEHESETGISFSRAVPALPVSSVAESAVWFSEQLGFGIGYRDEAIAVIEAGDVILHLWQAGDGSWRDRSDLVSRPVKSGAESFLAGTASCRIEVDAIDALFAEVQPRGILHYSSHKVVDTDYGSREFHVSDPDGNLVTFTASRGMRR